MNIHKLMPKFPASFDGEGDDTISKADAAKMVEEGIAKAIAGIKTKNEELLGDQAKLKEKLKAFGDMTPEKLKEMMDKLDGEDDADLLKQGKIDEIVEKAVEKALAPVQEALEASNARGDEFEGKFKQSDARYQKKMIEDAIRITAGEVGVRPEALGDVTTRASSVFTLDANGELEARDSEGVLVKYDDKLLTPKLFIESLKEKSPHYWPESKSGDLSGTRGGGAGIDITEAKVNDAAASGNMDEFRKLRQKQKEG